MKSGLLLITALFLFSPFQIFAETLQCRGEYGERARVYKQDKQLYAIDVELESPKRWERFVLKQWQPNAAGMEYRLFTTEGQPVIPTGWGQAHLDHHTGPNVIILMALYTPYRGPYHCR